MNIEMANRLYNYRKQSGLSQEELADKLGISRQSVSKWERAESCPDTDNLIRLAKLYGVSIDTLLNVDPDEVITDTDEPEDTQSANDNSSGGANTESDYTDNNVNGETVDGLVHIKDGNDEVIIDNSGVHISDGKDEVHIGSISGANVKKKGKNHIQISFGDKKAESNDGGERQEGNNIHLNFNFKDRRRKYLKDIPIGVIVTFIYIMIGSVFGLWHPGWILFVAIPVIHSLLNVIYYKSIRKFNYPVFVVVVYLILGCVYNYWHPGWALFLTIPLFYWIF